MTTNYYFNGKTGYGRFDLSYPNSSFLTCRPISSLEENLNSALSQSLGYKYTQVLPQAELNSFYSSSYLKRLFQFSFGDDPITRERFRVEAQKTSYYSNLTTFKITQLSDQSAGQDFEYSFQNSIFYDSLSAEWTQPQFVISATEDSFALLIISKNKSLNTFRSVFVGFAKLRNVNPNFNFYDFKYSNSLCTFSSVNAAPLEIRYRLFDFTKLAHVGEKTNFPITCLDGRKPFQNWSTNCLVFDEYPQLKNPLIGTTSDLFALGWGTFNVNQLAKITSGISDSFPPYYIPIANYGQGNKIFLMRVDSDQ